MNTPVYVCASCKTEACADKPCSERASFAATQWLLPPTLKKYWVVIGLEQSGPKTVCLEIDATSTADAVELAWLESKVPSCFWEHTQVYVFESSPVLIIQK